MEAQIKDKMGAAKATMDRLFQCHAEYQLLKLGGKTQNKTPSRSRSAAAIKKELTEDQVMMLHPSLKTFMVFMTA